MSIKRLIGAIVLRTLLIGGAVTGLCFAFPSLLAGFVTLGAVALVGSTCYTVHKCKQEAYFDDVPCGDLEYYELPEAKNNVYNKIETKVLDTFEELPQKIKRKKENKNNAENEPIK